MNARVLSLAAACVVVGLASGSLATYVTLGRENENVLEEVRATRKLLSELREHGRDSSPILTTVLQPVAAPCPQGTLNGPNGALTNAPAAATKPPVEPTDENRAAFATADKMVAAGMASGHWTPSDERELFALGRKMTPEQFFELQKKLAVAINTDKLIPE